MGYRQILVICLFFSLYSNNAYAFTCSNCAECSNIVSGNHIELSQDITSTEYHCISNSSIKDITIDCNGYSIQGNGNYYGIYLTNAENITITNCIITNFDYGIYLFDYLNKYMPVKINNTNINNCTTNGIYLEGKRNTTILNSTITNNGNSDASGAGIKQSSSTNTSIISTAIYSNKYGIYTSSSPNTTITHNTITNNRYIGIYIKSGSDDNQIYSNKIRNNSIDLSPRYEIQILSGATYNSISGNSLKYPIDNNEPTTNITDNHIGYDRITGPDILYITDASSIQETTTISSPYDRILILPGTYTESVDITKPVTLIGHDRQSTTVTSPSTYTIRITGGATTLDNLTITSSGEKAIYLTSGNNTIKDTDITSAGIGIYSYLTDNNTISNTNIDAATHGISAYHTTRLNITGSSITGSLTCIYLENTTSSWVEHSTIHNQTSTGGHAIHTSGSHQNRIHNNTIQDNYDSIYLYNSDSNTVTSNHITSSSSKGILAYQSDNTTIRTNTIDHTDRAIMLDNTDSSTVENNTVRDNTNGLRIVQGSSNNITGNTFHDNTEWGINLDYSNGNNLWMNNFTDTENTFIAYQNDYCINGLDNHYPDSPTYSEPPYSCERSFTYTVNDTKIYLSHAVELQTDTSGGESSYATINMTLTRPDNTQANHTLTLDGTDSINGIWKLIYTLTNITGHYTATIISYIESDDDTGQSQVSSSASFDVLDLNISSTLSTGPYGIGDTVTITSTIHDNASEIENITSRTYWNNTLVGETSTSEIYPGTTDNGYIHTTSEEYETYIGRTTTDATHRSGTYTINTTVHAGIEKTNTTTFHIGYGTSTLSITGPTSIAKNKNTNLNYTLAAQDGDLDNITLTFTSSNTSSITTSTNSITIPYLNSSQALSLNLTLTGIGEGTSEINITATPAQGNSTTSTRNITVKELTLETFPWRATIDITANYNYIFADISGNVTPIEYMTAEVIWNGTSRLNRTYTYVTSWTENGETIYRYHAYIQRPYMGRSGNYTVITRSKADIETSHTTHFFINYGTPEISYDSETIRMQANESRLVGISLEPITGDLKDTTVTIISDNPEIVNLSVSDTPTRTFSFIAYPSGTGTMAFNMTGQGVGTTNITVTVTSYNSTTVTSKKEINITGESESNPPSVTGITTNSTISTFNLHDSILVTTRITDDSGTPPTKIAEITKPDNTKTNHTMAWTGTTGIYSTTPPFTNSTETGTYTIRIYTTDYYGNSNTTETSSFTVTDIYPNISISTDGTYNRGENATITILAYDINGNAVTGFNTTLNITYVNTTTLLENIQTGTHYYYINTSVLGTHYLDANISKYGNTGTGNTTFNVTGELDMSFYTSLDTYPQGSWIREFRLYAKYSRGDEYTGGLNASLYCYNDSESHTGTVPLTLASAGSNTYTYTTDGNPQCYAPTAACQSFSITANLTDQYNNTGTGTLTLSTPCSTSTSTSSGSGGGGSGGGATGTIQPPGINNTIYVGSNQANTTRDISLTIDKKEITITQGKNATIIAKISNIGTTGETVQVTITQDCFGIPFTQKTIFLNSKNDEELNIPLHAPLYLEPKECLVTVAATTENIARKYTIQATVEKNTLIEDLEQLEEKVTSYENDISSYKSSGIDTTTLEKALAQLKSQLENAKASIIQDNLASLETSVALAKSSSNKITTTLLRLKTEKWVRENKYSIATVTLASMVIIYISIYFIIPYIYLKKDLTALTNREIELKDAEKSVQKQYFMRELDENTFNKLISEKHSMLLDTRSEIRRIEEKIHLLRRGKLNLTEEEHSRYFIISRLRKAISKGTEPRPKAAAPQPIDQKRQLESEIYNTLQSIKEAENNYKNQIITADEYNQIKTRNMSKLDIARKKLESITGTNPKTGQSSTHPGTGTLGTTGTALKTALENISQKYESYRVSRHKKKVEKDIHMLEIRENTLRKKESDLKSEEQEIEDRIKTLKTEEKRISEKESEKNQEKPAVTGSESPKPQSQQQPQE